MIKFVEHHQIDKAKWDYCIEHANNSFIYAYSWYLDIAAPGWNAVIMGDYQAVMPVPTVKKFFTIAYQPFFTQQLGLFNTQVTGHLGVNDFLEALPAYYKYINICLNENNDTGGGGYTVIRRNNHVLYLHKPYEVLFKEFNEHNRRNVTKAIKFNLVMQDATPEEVVNFYIKYKSELTEEIKPQHYEVLGKLLNAAKDRNMLICRKVVDESGEMMACAAFYIQKNRIIYQIGAASDEGRKLRASFFIFNKIIEQFSNQDYLLDFEGSDIESIARFFNGFGSMRMPYNRIIANRLPWPLRWLKK